MAKRIYPHLVEDPLPEDIDHYARGVAKLMEIWARDRFKIDNFQGNGDLWTRWRISVKTSMSPKRRCSWGGMRFIRKHQIMMPFVSLALAGYHKASAFMEYQHLARKEKIGTFHPHCWQQKVNALVAHEVAHAIQHTILKTDSPYVDAQNDYVEGIGYYERAHGSFFQAIYTELREKFVNEYEVHDVGSREPRRAKKRQHSDKNPIATVEVKFGWYRNKSVQGKFQMLQGFKEHTNPERKDRRGFITVWSKTYSRPIRVQVDSKKDYDVLVRHY